MNKGKFLLNDPVEKYIPEFKNIKYYENGVIVDVNSKIKIIAAFQAYLWIRIWI